MSGGSVGGRAQRPPLQADCTGHRGRHINQIDAPCSVGGHGLTAARSEGAS